MANQVIGSNGSKKKPKKKLSGWTSKKEDTTSQSYWAKGTGFGTGSTSTQWDLEQVLQVHIHV